MPIQLLTTAQAAQLLGIGASRLRDIVAAGYRPALGRHGHAWLWSEADLVALRPRIQGHVGAPRGERNGRSRGR